MCRCRWHEHRDNASPAGGELLRDWRERRRLSQLELSSRAEIATRHLSFVETGRSRPTPQMILRLSDPLDVLLRGRNNLLLAGGFAPAYPANGLDAPEIAAVREALRRVVAAHEPFPALVVDRHWNLLGANSAVATLTAGAAAGLDHTPAASVVVSLRLGTDLSELAFFSIASHVQTAADVTVDQLAVEAFHPADEHTAAALSAGTASPHSA